MFSYAIDDWYIYRFTPVTGTIHFVCVELWEEWLDILPDGVEPDEGTTDAQMWQMVPIAIERDEWVKAEK